MKKIAWMSFDLGVQGDYEGLYRWLDAQGARECGDNLALFSFASKKDLPAEVKASVEKSVEIDARNRIYLIFMGKDRKMKGRFLFGQRRPAPWAGSAPAKGPIEDDEG
jgi:hypothetical protein